MPKSCSERTPRYLAHEPACFWSRAYLPRYKDLLRYHTVVIPIPSPAAAAFEEVVIELSALEPGESDASEGRRPLVVSGQLLVADA